MTTTLDTQDPTVLGTFLDPVSEEQPAGESLAEQGLFREIEELRRADDPSLPQGVWSHELKRADWPKVARLCRQALEKETKDLRLAAWLTEAWTHMDGLEGSAKGIAVLRGLCAEFWETVHPLPDGDDLGSRLAPILWLDGKLVQALKQTPVTEPDDGQDTPQLSWNDWEWALHFENLKEADPAAAQEQDTGERVTKDKFQISANLTATDFFERQLARVEQVEGERAELAETLDALAGKDAPNLRKVRHILADLSGFLKRTLRQRADSEELLDEALAEDTADETEGTTEGGRPGSIRSRAEAYRLLTLAADFLMRTEPHSPAPYLVQRAVTWGNMTLIELYGELLAGGADLKSIYRLLGIKED